MPHFQHIHTTNSTIPFISEMVTVTQSAYSNLDSETLTIVNGVAKFPTYLFGKRLVIITDHNPVLVIYSNAIYMDRGVYDF